MARGDAVQPPAPGASYVELAWLDRRGVIVAVNDAWRAFCTANGGDARACGPGVSYLDVCDADSDSAPVARSLRALLSGAQVLPARFTAPCDGPASPRWFDVQLTPRLSDTGAVEGALVALTPVGAPPPGLPADGPTTDLIEYVPDGALLVDGSGTVRYANRQLLALSGYSREELIGQAVELLVPGAQRARHRAWREGYQTAPRDRPMGTSTALTLRTRDGAEVPVEISLAPMPAGGLPMTFASVRDVGELRAQDHARRRLLHLLDLDPDAVWVVDAETAQITYANSGASQLLGYSKEELLAMTLWDLSPTASECGRRSVLEEHAEAGPGHTHQLEVVRRRRDGVDIPCDTRGQLVADPHGGRAFIIVDRDARPRLARERERLGQLGQSRLVAEVTQMLLSDEPSGELYQRFVSGAAALLDADDASLVVYDPDTDLIDNLAAVGAAAEQSFRHGVSLDKDVVLPWMRASTPVLLPDGPPVPAARRSGPSKGPGVIAQFRGSDERLGLLSLFRRAGREPFTEAEGALLSDMASQVALVVEIGHARLTSQRLEIVEERQRIARDLHDMVIQDLIGIGMQLGEAADATAVAGDDADLVSQLDDTIRRLRLVVFDARTTVAQGPVDDEVRRTVREAARTLDHRPELTLDGDLDALPPDVVSHLLSVLREGLSNVARHARASQTVVRVTAGGGRVSVSIDDDGRGLGDRTLHGTGTASMRERAEMVSGTLSLTDRPDGGARLTWTATIPG